MVCEGPAQQVGTGAHCQDGVSPVGTVQGTFISNFLY